MTKTLTLRLQSLGYLNTYALGLCEDLHNCGGYRYAILSDSHNTPTTVKKLLSRLLFCTSMSTNNDNKELIFTPFTYNGAKMNSGCCRPQKFLSKSTEKSHFYQWNLTLPAGLWACMGVACTVGLWPGQRWAEVVGVGLVINGAEDQTRLVA